MASTKPRHVLFNPQEAATTTDQTRQASLHHAALLALGAAVLQGDSSVYGVVSGLTVTATGADRNVIVAAGLALRLGSAASAYDSAVSWIEQRTASTIDISAHIDGANPRWVAIEITDGYTAEAQEPLRIWNPATQSYNAPALYDKIRVPAPVISVRAGTPAANPVFPPGGAGVIPLAYVYLGAGAVTVQATDIVMCRPMLRGDAGGDQSAPGRDVYGGGVEVATAGLALSLRNAGGRFAGSRVRWGISAADGTTAYTLAAQGMDGAALPVADDVIYFYACPPPYPAGYDSNLAPREHRPGATALTRYQGMAVADVHNAVIVASTVEPQVNTPLGSPTAGNFTMTCAPFAAAATIDRTTVAYLGAASWDFSGTDLLEQSMRGTTVIAGTATSTDNIVPGGAAAYNLWGVGGGAMLFPVSARLVSAAVDVSDNDSNDGDALTIRVDDETSVTWRWETWRAPFIGSFHYVLPATFNVSAAGNVTVTSVSGAAFDDIRIRSTGYEDCILGSR